MAEKLAIYADRAGVSPQPIVSAYKLSIERRLAVLGDVFHPDLLHPARTALILLQDVGCTDADVLAAAVMCETEYDELRITDYVVRSRLGAAVAGMVAGVPIPAEAGDALAEELVTAPDESALIAVAERLDHARHLKFRDTMFWLPFHQQIQRVYLPFSTRVSAALEMRLLRWSEAFAHHNLAKL
jgi:hypothetical protein